MAYEPVKTILQYRSKKKVHDAVTAALVGRIEAAPVVKSTANQDGSRGPKPRVVKDFNNDDRSNDMSIYIGQGLSIEEAGILAHFSPEELAQLQAKSETYRRFVELQVIKFKQKHLKVISSKENPATSQWLLEQKFPETYGKKAKDNNSGVVGSEQIIQAIVKSVQMTGDNLVKHEDDDKKEKQINSGPLLIEGDKSSTDVGGANIL